MTDPPGGRDVDPRLRWAAVAVVVLPIVVAVVRAIRSDWFPIGDSALLYLRTRDVLTAHHPWLGSWTSASLSVGVDMNNPGPLYADLVAPFAHLFSPGVGNALGVGVLNAASVLGISIASHKIGGWAFERWMLAATAVLMWSMGSELLFDIFQAHALMLPFLLLLVLVAGAATGRAWCVPWIVLVGSVLLQTHISYAYIAVVLAVAGVVLALRNTEAPRAAAVRRAARSRTTLWSGVLFLVLWSQTFLEQFFGAGPGNLGRLLSNSGGGDVDLGLATAAKITSAVMALPPWWSRSGFADTVPGTPLTDGPDGPELLVPGLPGPLLTALGLVVLLAATLLVALEAERRERRALATAAWLAAVLPVGSVLALAVLTIGPVGFAPHHVRWVFAAAAFVHAVLVWGAVELLPGVIGDRVRSAATTAATVVIVVASVANLPYHAQQQGPVADTETMPALRRAFDALAPLDRVDPILFDTSNVRIYEPYSSAVMMAMQDQGIEFRVTDEGLVRQLGDRRRASGDETATVRQFEGAEAVWFEGDGCVLVVASALPPDEEDARRADADALVGLVADGSIDVSPASTAPVLSDVERQLAVAAIAGDVAATRRIVGDGLLVAWRDRGLVSGEPEALEVLDDTGDHVVEWVRSSYALVVTPSTACG